MRILRFLALALLLFAGHASAWTRGTTGTVVTGDFVFNSSNPWTIGMGPFNGVHGTYYEAYTYFPVSINIGAAFTWSFPNAPCASICGFNHLDYGDYSSGPTTFITPKQISGITTLVSSQNLSFSGTTNGNDIFIDLFLGTTQHGIDALEISIFFHAPNYTQSTCSGGTSEGTLVNGGITWTVTLVGGVTACFVPNPVADVPISAIDLKAMFLYLVSQSVIANTVWYHGHAVGVEPRNGTGQLQINSLSVVYN